MRIWRRSLAILAVVFFATSFALSSPVISKVEPPNWWVGLPHNPTLLIYGRDLQSATVRVNYPGVTVSRVEPQTNGHHLFIALDIKSKAKPGTVHLTIETQQGRTSCDLLLLAREPQQGRAVGLSQDDVVYLIMPDRFANGDPGNDNPAEAPGQMNRAEPRMWHGGDLKGILNHLDYLKDLGATAIWLTPWTKQDTATSDYHGYHVVDFYAVEPHLGSIDDVRQLARDAHARGMKLIIDYVVNHTGPNHPWANDPPTATWLNGTPQKHLQDQHDFQQLLDPHATPRQSRGVLEGWFANRLPDINVDDPLAGKYLADNAIWWMEIAGLDAVRLDTFPYSSRSFWSKWHQDLFKVYPQTTTVGEVLKGDPWLTSFFVGGNSHYGIDTHLSTVFDFPLGFAIRDVAGKGESPKKIVEILQHDSLYNDPGRLVTVVGNHDISRILNVAGGDIQRARAATSLLLTMRGIPQLYAGDEIAMSGGDDPDNRHDFPGGWVGDSRNAFTAQGRTPSEQQMFIHTQTLLRLRREHPALRAGKQWHIGVSDSWYAYLRESANDRVLSVFNNSDTAQKITLPVDDTPLQNVTSLAPLYEAGEANIVNRQIEVSVPAHTVAIYTVQRDR